MAHIASLNSSVYTSLKYAEYTSRPTTPAGWLDLADSDGVAVGNVREFPSMGTPANIVNVPVYGQKTSSQVQGQADAPSLEITVNYVAEDMTAFHDLIDGAPKVFRFMMTAAAVTEADSTGQATLATDNTEFYFTGKVEAILVNPALTDATTATITLSAQTDFVGPATLAAA